MNELLYWLDNNVFKYIISKSDCAWFKSECNTSKCKKKDNKLAGLQIKSQTETNDPVSLNEPLNKLQPLKLKKAGGSDVSSMSHKISNTKSKFLHLIFNVGHFPSLLSERFFLEHLNNILIRHHPCSRRQTPHC